MQGSPYSVDFVVAPVPGGLAATTRAADRTEEGWAIHGLATQGVFDMRGEALAQLNALLTFDAPPSKDELRQRAIAICALAEDYHAAVPAAMIGGAPFFMGPLGTQLKRLGIQPLYAFSIRVVEEKTLPDGSVQEVAVFRHQGFVEA